MMITDSVSETLIVYTYSVILLCKILRTGHKWNFIETFLVKAHCWSPFFLTLTTILFQKMDYFCATSLVMFSFFACMLRLVILSIVLDSRSILKSVMILPINPIGLQEQWNKSNEIFKILQLSQKNLR